jgi:hypothetical protein
MTHTTSRRAHLVAGGFPPGASAGHDHDDARLQLLQLLAEEEVPSSVANDFADVEKWLPLSRLLITYVAGPYPDAAQCGALRRWMEDGGRWLALHGTSGGRAERVEGVRQRRTVKLEHHALLGSYFLTHPPICKIRVDVTGDVDGLTRGLPASFDVEDEPYFIELQDPATARIVLTADYGAGVTSPTIGTLYASTRRSCPTVGPACSATRATWARAASPTSPWGTATTPPSADRGRIPRTPRRSRSAGPGRSIHSGSCCRTPSRGACATS